MSKFMCCLLALLMITVPCVADQPILLITPHGVWQADVINGVPGQFKQMSFAVIIQGFDGGDTPPTPKPPTPIPPVVTTNAEKVAKISAAPALASKEEATAAAALVNSLSKAGLKEKELVDAMLMTASIVDAQLKSATRIRDWCVAATKITSNPTDLIGGLVLAWQIDLNVLRAVETRLSNEPLSPEEMDSVEAFDITTIMAVIQMIIALLQQLGILK